ncbi:hypothetical protein [Clostridium intestinale]|uniref:hypothetical protein n=1 Tax=Clostridium intestinale TaxID=36845 RepID=UPI0028E68623|nr:hypothetical protein [Clostridium intestinale]
MRIKKVYKVSIIIVFLACIVSIFYFNSKTIMFSSNMNKGIDNYWNDKVSIKEVKDFEVYGKKFKLVLSTPINNEKYKYLNCYEEKMNGLYYKSYRAAEQGGSNSLFSFSTIFVNDVENYFTIVYGYNKDAEVVSYEIKVSEQEKSIVSNVSSKEYFIDAFKGHIQDTVKVIGEDGSNKINVFED